MFHSKQKAVKKLSLMTTETDILKKGGEECILGG